MTALLDGKAVLIVGASTGIGVDAARVFAEEGARLVLSARSEEALESLAAELRGTGHDVRVVVGDVTSGADVARMVDETVAAYGRLDGAFNNAGIQAPPTDAADEPAAVFDRVNAINLRGVWACMKHELRQMRAQGSGAIVNCSSLGGLVGLPGARPTTPPSTG